MRMQGGPVCPLDALASLLKTHRMATNKGNDASSGFPEAGKRVVEPGCGRPAATPEPSSRAGYPQTELSNSVTLVGEIVGPVGPEEHWESLVP